MSRKALFIGSIITIAAIGSIGYPYYQSQQTAYKLQQAVDSIALQYTSMLTDDLRNVKNASTLNANEKRQFTTMLDKGDALSSASSIETKVRAIIAFQTAAHALLGSVGSKQLGSAFTGFKQQLGQNGKVRKQIQQYNGLANIRNKGGQQTFLSSLLSDVSHDEKLPMMRYDGSKPDIGNISLGG